jgi:hypothetical protein
MATNTYVALQTQTLTSATASVTFSSISQAYTDLVLVINGGSTNRGAPWLRFNSDSGSNYSNTALVGNGTAATSNRSTSESVYYYGGWIVGFQTSLTGNAIINIQNYSNTTTYKTAINRFNLASGELEAITGVWRSTAAINSITLSLNAADTYLIGTTFTLYGISNAGDIGTKATGGNITSVGGFTYHTFTMSGNFVPNQSLSTSVLVVGGGGGGGCQDAGGGGAGEIDLFATQSLTAQSYAVTVGGGGAGGTSSSSKGGQGNTSQFIGASTITALGGGGGGSGNTAGGANGGSGGGGSAFPSSGAGGSASGSNTFAGGSGTNTAPNYGSGGGGGATAVGQNGSGSAGGAGGAGYALTTIDSNLTTANFSILTGMTHLSAGGGGAGYNGASGAGGSSGQGGRGGDGVPVPGNPAISFGSGGGGGSGGSNTPGGNGYAGVVIIKYAN